ncbi:MAG: hypothetical protein WC415_06460 [Patescibacteria group bacterium]|jgi:hypothetical protein
MAYAKFDMKKLLSSDDMQRQINNIRRMGELRLTEAIWDNVYAVYKPKTDPKIWHRTYQLLHSVSSSFKIIGNQIEIKVFCDPEKMDHYSIIDNQPTYVPGLINTGFYWSGWGESESDYFHNRPASHFLEKAMEQIQRDMQEMLINAVIVAFNSNRYR